jgi:hypothetical protein
MPGGVSLQPVPGARCRFRSTQFTGDIPITWWGHSFFLVNRIRSVPGVSPHTAKPRGPLARGGVPKGYARDLRPLAAVPLAGICTLAKQAASSTPPHRPGSPEAKPHLRAPFRGCRKSAASRRSGGAVRPASRSPFPGDPGIRGPLHPLRHRCPPSPYRGGYASVGRLAGSGASTLSMHGLFGNGSREAGAQPCRFTARRATNGAPSEAAER